MLFTSAVNEDCSISTPKKSVSICNFALRESKGLKMEMYSVVISNEWKDEKGKQVKKKKRRNNNVSQLSEPFFLLLTTFSDAKTTLQLLQI